MNILDYPVVGLVETEVGTFPLLDIPMMSDERWQQLTRENTVHNYTQVNDKKTNSAKIFLDLYRNGGKCYV